MEAWNKGLKTGLVPKSAFKKGMVPWNKGLKNTWFNPKGLEIGRRRKGHKFSDETKEKMRLVRLGRYGAERHWNWRGGITPISHKIRNSDEYKIWRKAVFERDDHTCQSCFKRGGDLEADHIKPFALFPELRFITDNGLTLCKPCHRKTPTFGQNIKRLSKQFEI